MSKTDRISELPEETLSSIVSWLNVREAVQASILSSRWNYICTSMSNLHFCSFSMFPVHRGLPPSCYAKVICSQYKDRFVEGVNQFIRSYKGSRVVYFKFSFCLRMDSARDIDRWVSFALNMGVERLFINLACKTPCISCLSDGDDNLYILRHELFSQVNIVPKLLQHLLLHSCILGPGVAHQFNLLQSLYLVNVPLGQREVESILACCLKLESLTLTSSQLPDKLIISGSPHRLKFLGVFHCKGSKEIKIISAPNLTSFEFSGDPIKFSFNRDLILKKVFFRAEKQLQYIFTQLAKDLPLVETLLVFSRINWAQELPENITTFSKLKTLEFFSYQPEEFDNRKIIAILEACPLLEKFYLGRALARKERSIRQRQMPAKSVHKHLNEVHIGGFRSKVYHIELAIFMMEYAVALDRMVIDPQMKTYAGSNQWFYYSRVEWNKGEREKVCERLQGYPKSAALVIL